MSGVPAIYNFHASLTGAQRLQEGDSQNDDMKAISSKGWPDQLLDSAVRALDVPGGVVGPIKEDDLSDAKIGRLEEEVTDLKQQLAALRALEERRNARRDERQSRRDEVGAKRRAAYFEAKREAKDGDAAMRVWEDEEAKIDAESDDEALVDKMDVT